MRFGRIGLFAAVFLAGCTTNGVSQGYSMGGHPDEGLIVAAITYKGVYSKNEVVFWPAGQKKVTWSWSGMCCVLSFGESQMLWPVKGDYADQGYDSLFDKGAIVAVEAPPGTYELHSWTVSGALTRLVGQPESSIVFTVKPGAVTYVGAYEFTHDLSGLAVRGASLSVSDKFDRDLPIFRKKYPSMADTPVEDALQGTDTPIYEGDTN